MPIVFTIDKAKNSIPAINIRISIGHEDSDNAIFDYDTDNNGTKGWPIPFWPHSDYTMHVNKRNVNPNYQSAELYIPKPPTDNYDDVYIELARTPRQKLYISNKRIYLPDGKPFYIKGESAFLDYYRFLRGEDIRPVLAQSLKIGGNCRRNFMMTKNTGEAGGIGKQEPEMYGNAFYDRFPEFMGLYAEYGQYGYFSIFPDNGYFSNWSGNTNKQKDHWNRLGNIAAGIDNVFAFELTNEPEGHSENKVNASAFSKIPNLLCCPGSYGEGEGRYPPPYWDFGDHHAPRSYPNSVKDVNASNNPNRLAGEAVLSGEPLGFGDPNLNHNRNPNPELAREMAGSPEGTTIGIFYHTQHGGFSQLYDDIEWKCGIEWFSMLR